MEAWGERCVGSYTCTVPRPGVHPLFYARGCFAIAAALACSWLAESGSNGSLTFKLCISLVKLAVAASVSSITWGLEARKYLRVGWQGAGVCCEVALPS